MPICHGHNAHSLQGVLEHIIVSSVALNGGNVYLQHIDVKAKRLQGHFKHNFLGQEAVPLKDHVALH